MTPFRAGARAGAASAMCSFVSSPYWMCHVSTHSRHYADPHSYNRVNGTYACGLGSSLNRNLKGDLNWTGFITSDWSSADMCSLRACVRVCVCWRCFPTATPASSGVRCTRTGTRRQVSTWTSQARTRSSARTNCKVVPAHWWRDADPRPHPGDSAALTDMATRVVAALISVDAFDHPVCTGGQDCGHFLYEVRRRPSSLRG